MTVDVKDEQDRKSERKMTFDKADLESSGLRLQKTFSVKLTVNTEVKEKVKNVLILVMEDSLVLLEVKVSCCNFVFYSCKLSRAILRWSWFSIALERAIYLGLEPLN